MGIEDIQISEELETSAPSIRYSGDEGPKSPQEEMMMVDAVLEEEYEKYVFDLLEQRPDAQPMSMEEFKRMVIGDMTGGQPLPQDPTKPVNPFGPKPTGPVLPNRQMAAYGGIMGIDGRRQYGFGSSIKKRIRKLIPNEVAAIAETAAPFVAPFNPALAGVMSAVGGFDRTGRIGSSLKSGLKNYAMGQLSRGIGGGKGNLQANPFRSLNDGASFAERFQGFGDASKMGSGFGKYFSSPVQASGGIGEILADKGNQTGNITETISDGMGGEFEVSGGALKGTSGKNVNSMDRLFDRAEIINKNPISKLSSKIMEYVPTSFSDLTDPKKIIGGIGIFELSKKLLGPPKKVEDQIMKRGEGLDLDSIRAEVREAFSDETGVKLKALRNKYPYLGRADTKDIANMAMGGRIGFAEGGGIMDLGGMEKDYRAEGGFVPIGREEKADDVPARLSVNEFVFTADAVRNAGGGDIDRGAEVMENMMKNLEAGGQVSEESQGMQGAQQMFETSQRLSEVI